MCNPGTLFSKLRHLVIIPLLLLTSCTPLEHTFQAVRIQFLSPSQRYLQEGDRLSAMNRTAEAIMAYRRAVDLDAKNLPALIKLSNGYAKQGRKRLARRFLLNAQTLHPENLTVQQALDTLQSPSSTFAALQLQRIISVGQAEPTGMAVSGEMVFITLVDGQVSAYQLE